MSKKKLNRTKSVIAYLTPDEYKEVKDHFCGSVCRTLSGYARKLILKKPVTIFSRNQSLDDFMEEMITLRSELNALANNYNLVVKKMHTLEHIPEFKSWVILNEKQQQNLLLEVEQIKEKINSIADKWLQ